MDRRVRLLSWLSLALTVVALLWWGYDLLAGGFGPDKLIWLLFFMVLLIGAWLTRPRDLSADEASRRLGPAALDLLDDNKPLISLVLLLKQPRPVDYSALMRLVRHAWGTGSAASQPVGWTILGAAPSFVVKAGGRSYLVNSFALPYFPDPQQAAAEVGELRLKKIVSEHRGWISVDLLNGEGDRDEAYRWIGKLIAELAGKDCLAIYAPALSRLNVYDSRMRPVLRGDRPLELFERPGSPPVLRMSGDDPRMKEAVAEAQRRWPEFVEAFERRSGVNFSAKAPFTDGGQTEYMWLSVTAIEHGTIYGKLGNEPVNIHHLSHGDAVKVKVEEVNDWMYLREGKVQGGFTIELMRKVGKK
jgi:uncharacterized protein YegJ (DUF2314 family)